MSKPRILYDGWPLVYAPDSPAALHLLTLLDASSSNIDSILAIPAAVPAWLNIEFQSLLHRTENTAKKQSRWIQRVLPALAKEHQVDALHLVSEQAPFNAPVPVYVSPASLGQMSAAGLGARLRDAVGQGGLSRSTVLWPEDLADFAPDNAQLLPPVAPKLLAATQLPGELEDEETFILVHGVGKQAALKKVLDTWTWAHTPIGSIFPLVFVGLSAEARDYVLFYAEEYEIAESIFLLPQQPHAQLAALYQHSTVVFHPARTAPWGNAVRLALTCHKPLLSYEHPEVEAVVGPAGFLLNNDRARVLAGGIIAMTNKEAVAEELQEKSKAQSATWDRAAFQTALLKVYADIK